MKLLIGVFAFLLIAWLVIGSPFIFGDGYGYYHAGKTLVTNSNFATLEKPEYYNYTGHGVVESDGKYITPYTIGNGLLWIPFLAVSSASNTGNLTNDYFKAFNGHSLLDGMAISISALLFASLTIVVIYKTILLLDFGKKLALFSTLTTFLGSFALAYTIINSAYSHIYEIFIFTLIIYNCLKLTRTRSDSENSENTEKWRLVFIGILFGLLFLIRPFNILLLIPAGLYLFKNFKYKSTIVLLGGFPFSIIFLVYNFISYGSFFKTGYSLSDGFIFSFNFDRLVQLLFSDIRGWYVYTPLMFLSTVGLLILAKRKKDITLVTLVPVLTLIGGYSFWQNWWAGDSAGQRFFLVLLPLMSIGTAQFINYFKKLNTKKLALAAVTVCSIFSITLLILYRFTPTDKIGADRSDYQYINSYERFGVTNILNYHLKLITNSTSANDYLSKLQKGLAGGRSLLMIYLGLTKPIINIEHTENEISIYIIPTPTANDINSEIFVILEQGQEKKRYLISNPNTSEWSQIMLLCDNTCSSPNFDLKATNADFYIDYQQHRTIATVSGKLTIYVSDNLKLESPIRGE